MLHSLLVGIVLVLPATTNALGPAEPKRHLAFPLQTTDAGFLRRMAYPHGPRAQQKRATSATAVTWTISPDETCGYLSGSVGAPITCDNSAICEWLPRGGVLCEGGTTYSAHVSCYEMEDALNTDKCNDVCTSNIYNLLCTETSAPYCRTYVYPSDISDYRCGSTSETRVSSVSWTYEGQVNPGFTTTVIYNELETSSSESIDSISSSPPDVVSATETISTSQPAEPSPSSDSKTPVGAIVGGVVGGLAVVGFVIVASLYLLRRKRGQNENEATPHHPPPPIQTQFQPQFQPQPPVSMANTKPVVTSTAQSPTVASPVQSEWRGSSVMSPVSAVSPPLPSELGTGPPDYSHSIHELPSNQNNMH
ncbi:hypothetical protein B0J13DRAFT_627054 [Dactylonectria estremocensis]|uniref:Mid2 domain-containing protein n=1 Tax=Dactylonectria estremocensis TaxID=1079267 RepID=A0A9P9E3G4_9HYPO|nr:hypothetical protein B0J13DRAFT_627054 [Dactylonectria estremocensis]